MSPLRSRQRSILQPVAAFPDGLFPSPFSDSLPLPIQLKRPLRRLPPQQNTPSLRPGHLMNQLYSTRLNLSSDFSDQSGVSQAGILGTGADIDVRHSLVGEPQADGDGKRCEVHGARFRIVVGFVAGEIYAHFRKGSRKSPVQPGFAACNQL